jgi:hypothetical protein
LLYLRRRAAPAEAKIKTVPKEFIMKHQNEEALFPLGQLVATPGALPALEKTGQPPGDFLQRHVQGDWGEVCEEDRKENRLSLERGFRLLSVYRTGAGETVCS